MSSISKNHNNRRHYNWAIYNIADKFLEKYSNYYKGDMYDLGCGEKPYEDYFKKYCKRYIGVDWSGTSHTLKADIVADLNKKFPINDDVADIIVSFSVMEHLCEPQNFLNESYRILKDKGVMLLQVPWQWRVHEAPYDFFRYSPYGLEYMFAKAGFKDLLIEPTSGFFTTWIIKLNYFTLRFIRGPKLIKRFIKIILIPFWFAGQKLAPYLDKLDKNWIAEAQGYYVIGKKIN